MEGSPDEEVLQKFAASDLPPHMLKEAAELFSEHYGMWGPLHAKAGRAKYTTLKLWGSK